MGGFEDFLRPQAALETAYTGGPASGSCARKRTKSSQLLNILGAEAAQLGCVDPLQPEMNSMARDRPGLHTRLNISIAGYILSLEYALDYAIILLAIIILGVSDRATPRAGYIRKDSLYSTSYPLRANTVPSWSIPIYTVVAPAAFFAAYCAVFRRRPGHLHHLIIGLMTSVMVTGAITNCIKCPVGRLRPDFNARCWPDGKVLWEKENAWGGYANCTGNPDSAAEGRKSFPSGHSSWSAAGLCYVMWFLLDVLQPFNGNGHPWRLAVACLPTLGAVAVGVTRYMDYWHHWSDIVAGLLLGGFISWIVYKQQQAKGQQEAMLQDFQVNVLPGMEVQPLLNRPLEAERVLPV